MLRGLFFDTAIYSGGRLVAQVLSFCLLPLYTRYISIPEFAIIELVSVYTNFFTCLIGLNLTSGVARYYYEVSKPERLANNISSLFISFLLFIVLVIVFIIVGNNYSFSGIYKILSDHKYLILFQVFSVFLNNTLMFHVQIMKKPILFSIISILNILFTSCFTIYYVVYLQEGVTGFIFSKALGLLIVSILIIYFIYREFITRPSVFAAKEVLSFSLGSFSGMLFVKFRSVLDRNLIIYFLNEFSLGVLSFANKLSMPFVLFTESFRLSWVTFVSSTINLENRDELYIKAQNYFTLGLCLFSCLTIFFIKDLVHFLFPVEFHSSEIYLKLIIFNIILSNLSFLNVGLAIKKKMIYMSKGTILSGVINLILICILCPMFSLWGFLLSQTIASIVFIFYTYKKSQKFHYINFDISKIFLYLSFYIAVFAVVQILENLNSQFLNFTFVKYLLCLCFIVSFYLLNKKYFRLMFTKILWT